MAQEGTEEAPLARILGSIRAFVTYVPLRTEVPYPEHVLIPDGSLVYEIPPRASLDPTAEVSKAAALVGERPTAILLPGRAFDASGTRLGQGGGWYDRFLSMAPDSWVRIGFCFSSQFSEAPLPKQSWDEPVDVVCVLDSSTGTLSCRETRARLEAFDTLGV